MSHTDIPVIATPRLRLTPLAVADADDMVEVLANPTLYAFTGGAPPTVAELAARYGAQVTGSPDPDEWWLNWIVRLDGGDLIGFVQATVQHSVAEVAWLIGVPWQRNGYASEAAQAMCLWLRSCEVTTIVAHVHGDHVASQKVAQALGMQCTNVTDEDGELIWSTKPTRAVPAVDR